MSDDLPAELKRFLGDAADELAAASVLPTSFDPSVLATRLQRKVTDMKHVDETEFQNTVDAIDMEHFDDGELGSERRLSQLRLRRRGSLLRMGAGALAGALATGGFFMVRDGGLSTPAAQEVETAIPENPYLLKFANVPDGLCLQFANSIRTVADNPPEFGEAPTQFTRGESDVISISVNQYAGMATGIVGETIDVNGRTALLSSKNGFLGLSWKQGRTNVQMTGKGVSKGEFVAVAKSLVLRFDENGPGIGSVRAPGFTSEKFDPVAAMGYGSLSYGDCKAVPGPEPFQAVGISTAPKSSAGMFGFGDPSVVRKETPITIVRNGKEVKAKAVTTTYGGNDDNAFRVVTWTENDATVGVNYAKMELGDVKKLIEGLTESTLDEYEALGKTAKQPDSMMLAMPTAPGEAPRTELKQIGTFTVGKTEGKVMSATQGEKICVMINFGFSGGGGNCVGGAKEASLNNNSSGTTTVIASGVTSASITKATATLPNGKTVDVPSYQDDRLPKLRVFVLVRSKDDPIPTKITFTDAAGKVVSEQTSSDESGVAGITAATAVPALPPEPVKPPASVASPESTKPA
jgi:hypothetical protein